MNTDSVIPGTYIIKYTVRDGNTEDAVVYKKGTPVKFYAENKNAATFNLTEQDIISMNKIMNSNQDLPKQN